MDRGWMDRWMDGEWRNGWISRWKDDKKDGWLDCTSKEMSLWTYTGVERLF
jgi:hypothetical protein